MIGILVDQFLPYILGGIAAVVGVLGYGWRKKRQGRKEQQIEQRLDDIKEAKETRNALDAADRDGDAAKRLRDQGRLRD